MEALMEKGKRAPADADGTETGAHAGLDRPRRSIEAATEDASAAAAIGDDGIGAAAGAIIVSNRLPYRMQTGKGGEPQLVRSSGGLVTGLAPLHERLGSVWIGWTGDAEDLADGDQSRTCLDRAFERRGCTPVHLDADEAKRYYEGFSNSTVWPLFHSFPHLARFDAEDWRAYRRANERFCDAVVRAWRPGKVIWVHDYHLMLLPELLREHLPEAAVGFFLHIPFPDFETFRTLPWRGDLVRGILGADLVGFHADDYLNHFLTACRRLIGLGHQDGRLSVDGRTVCTGAFPLGIDYERFRRATARIAEGGRVERSAAQSQEERADRKQRKTMLSVERLDYSKGIPNRLRAFDAFLDEHPEWKGRVTLTLVTVPSREGVSDYRVLKQQIDALVGRVNGKHAAPDWTPVGYYYRPVPFERLIELYAKADVMLVTPLRDGMNLVSKEYLACHDGREGVLVLSEMAGAAHELPEALMVNPFDCDGMVRAMERALAMPPDEQCRRNAAMQRRLARNTAESWARTFLDALEKAKRRQRREAEAGIAGGANGSNDASHGSVAGKTDASARTSSASARPLEQATARQLLEAYRRARRRAVLLDYDGTLAPFADNPARVLPDARLKELLRLLGTQSGTHVVIVSGRDRATMEAWLGALPIDLVAEHGAWLRRRTHGRWALCTPFDTAWKKPVRAVIEHFAAHTPGSLLEEKSCMLAWHYRACAAELAQRRADELKRILAKALEGTGLAVLEGNNVIEVKPEGVSKGRAARLWLRGAPCDFMLAAGDDRTDEDLFAALPANAWTIKVGDAATVARFALKDYLEMRELLRILTVQSAPAAHGILSA